MTARAILPTSSTLPKAATAHSLIEVNTGPRFRPSLMVFHRPLNTSPTVMPTGPSSLISLAVSPRLAA